VVEVRVVSSSREIAKSKTSGRWPSRRRHGAGGGAAEPLLVEDERAEEKAVRVFTQCADPPIDAGHDPGMW
jgi:hypothetical protein